MRIGPDVAPNWEPSPDHVGMNGYEETSPSTRNAWQSALARSFLHRRFWLNDPDCIMLRTEHTDLAPESARAWALAVGASGGMALVSDDLSLLGPAERELLDEVVDALGAGDAAAAFGSIDRVVQTGQDPRRFVDDLLERLRDLIVVAATGSAASAVLRGVPADELERMGRQAGVFGADALSRVADLVSAALDDMSGATSPRLQLELMVARVLTATVGAQGGAGAAAALKNDSGDYEAPAGVGARQRVAGRPLPRAGAGCGSHRGRVARVVCRANPRPPAQPRCRLPTRADVAARRSRGRRDRARREWASRATDLSDRPARCRRPRRTRDRQRRCLAGVTRVSR